MNSLKYKKMDKFVNEMNQSVNVVGDMSIYLFSRFRNFVGYLFITITTVAISFIVAEFVRGFRLAPIMGIDLYYVVLLSSLVLGLYIAFYGEEAKIATIKGAIFSSGSNRTWQAGAALAIILVLIIVNAKGVQKIADFSFRYMDSQLQESVIFKLKETKMQNHASLASTNINFSSQNSALKALFQSRESYENAKLREIKSVEKALNSDLLGRDSYKFRTYISQKRLEAGKRISIIEDRWNRKILKLDQKISNLQNQLNKRIDIANSAKLSHMNDADKATEDLIKYYKNESNNNKNTIDMYKNIGLIVAVGGEIVDGLLAFLLFMIVKSNPNVSGTPKVQENTRKMTKLKSYDGDISNDHNENVNNTPFKSSQKESLQSSIKNNKLNNTLFEKIKKVSSALSYERNDFIKVGMNRYLKHPSQREIIKAFREYGVTITPYQVSAYFTKMEDEIMFVNQKIGFVYTKIVKKVAA